MSLTGVDPNDPRPAIRREFVFGAGPPSGLAPSRPVVLWGNKTSAGSETVNVLGDPVTDDANAMARAGAKSELYAMYRKFTAVPQAATIYFMATSESGGTAASVIFDVSGGNSDAVTTYKINIGGNVGYYTTASGDEEQVTAEGLAAVITDMDQGRLLVTPTTAIDGGGPDWSLTLTFPHKGTRGDNYIGSGATYGCTIVAQQSNNTQTVTKGSLTAGTTEDDWTTAIAYMANEEVYYHVSAKAAVATVTATDNGLGEHMTMLATAASPVNGKDQRLIFANVGTNAQAIAVAVSSAMNSAYATVLWAEKHNWTTAEIAGHYAGVIRANEIAHPCANINGWTATDNQTWLMPPHQNKGDYPTASEVIAALNNGVTPMTVRGGRSYIERHITTRSLNALASNDYRAREGHIPSGSHFFWAILRQRYEAARQPWSDADPIGAASPAPRTQTPGMVKALIAQTIRDLSTGSFQSYSGPILSPSHAEADAAAVTVEYDGKGGFPSYIPHHVSQHTIKWESTLAEQSDAY